MSIRLKKLLPLITEAYHPPGNAETWCMDVYALYALWWELGSGKTAYGHQSDTIRYTPHMRVKAIDEAFYQALYGFAKAIHDAVSNAVYEELENSVDEYLIPKDVLHRWWSEQNADLKSGIKTNPTTGETQLADRKGFFSQVGWNNIIRWFNAPFWKEHADEYGGPKWAKVSECNTKLLDTIKHDDPKDIIHALDQLMDLQHNTGSILTKNKVGNMAISTKILDIRARLRSVNEYVPYVSDQVKNLIKSAGNYLTEQAFKNLDRL